jgi:hypothetical protein
MLEFNVPPTWPTPARYWVEGNAGWEPPIGWTPVPEARPAPDGWGFWSINHDVWAMDSAHARKYANDRLVLSLAIVAVGIAGLVIDLSDSVDAGIFSTAWVLIAIAGSVGVIQYPRRLRAITGILVKGASNGAANRKISRDNSAYLDYLLSFWDAVADRAVEEREREEASDRVAVRTASRPMESDEFAAQRDARAWLTGTGTAAAPADEAEPPSKDVRPIESLLRERGAVLLSLFGWLVMGAALSLLLNALIGTLTGRFDGPDPHSDFSVALLSQEEKEDIGCAQDGGCYMFEIETDRECSNGYTALVRFADSSGERVISEREYEIPGLTTRATAFLIIGQPSSAPASAGVEDVYCSVNLAGGS